jgi:hypothetical protein
VIVMTAPKMLDWREFSAAYFPSRRRHDMEALIAYGAYKGVHATDEPASEDVAPALDAWEDEGGPAL